MTRYTLVFVPFFIVVLFAAMVSAEEVEGVPQTDSETSESTRAQFETKESSEQVSTTTFPEHRTEIAEPREEFFGSAHRLRIYDESRLSHKRAALYSLALPGLGNLYTEQYFSAGLAFSMLVFSGIFIVYGLRSNRNDVAWLGASITAVTYGISLGTSLRGVTEYNRVLRRSLKVDEEAMLRSSAPTLNITIQF